MDNKNKGKKYGVISLVGFALNLATCLISLAYIQFINPSTSGFRGVLPLIISFFIIGGSTLTSIIAAFRGFALFSLL